MSLECLRAAGFDAEVRNHAAAILARDFAEPLRELCDVLMGFSIEAEELVRSGGGEAAPTQRLRRELTKRGWNKRNIEIKKLVDGVEKAAISHEIDHVRATTTGKVALEIEWNNKDPFFDRDLENFQRLHAEGAISVGVVVTRGRSLQSEMLQIVRDFGGSESIDSYEDLERFDVTPTRKQRERVRMRTQQGGTFLDAWVPIFVGDKYGASTTHWDKLMARLTRGVGNPCPLLLIGIPASAVNP